ncbi:hypothetical protein PMKS-003865 [Pichia membranifaciens]|uniref:DUF1279 domain-containing protein n=1 Tax=Pichia membranifaciens TaxID=4926 RepID=A0A1Q2YLE2_9ASCO|nr:hypothetical protein PMKS-003865 [Pichia membranifaciens]
MFASRVTRSTSRQTPPAPPTGIKKLIQQYGYSALGVYLGLSLIDLPICFIVVHSAGEDQIRDFQDRFLTWIGYKKTKDPQADSETAEPEEKSSTWMTEFALAYAIHKSLIFIRLPITAAITPWVVGRLQKMGFKIGKISSSQIAAAVQKGAKKFDPTGKS